jgi:hypothetical protein
MLIEYILLLVVISLFNNKYYKYISYLDSKFGNGVGLLGNWVI